MIDRTRLRTPPEHLGLLCEPTPAHLRASLQAAPGAFPDAPLLDSRLAQVRADLRRALALPESRPIVATGHQAEYFHAGVFAKTVAAHALAERAGGTAVFVTVDADLPKTQRLVLPETTPHGLRRVEVLIPGCEPQLPYESQPRIPRSDWLQFFATLASLHEFRDRALLDTFARAFLTIDDPNPVYCAALARGHAAVAGALGLSGIVDLRLSHLASTAAFRAYVATFLLAPQRTAEAYNAAQHAYRATHGVRATGRPVPPLLVRGDTVELPFWVLRPDEPRRRLFVRTVGDDVELATDNRVLGAMPRAALAEYAYHVQPWPLERAGGWHLRPRALTLSGFLRLVLADAFIHGIGGAKYDEMTEGFLAACFGVSLAPLGCVSATVHLPLPQEGVTEAHVRAARHRSRDLRFNPQRHVRGIPDRLQRQRSELVRQSHELRAHQRRNAEARRLVFLELRRLNTRMLEHDPWRAAEYDEHVAALEARLRIDSIARDREYFYALHVQETLAVLVARIRALFLD